VDIFHSRLPGFMGLHNLNTNSSVARNAESTPSTADLVKEGEDVEGLEIAVDAVAAEAMEAAAEATVETTAI
jgi:hypothetical protein